MTNEVQGEAGDARGGRCGAVLDWHDGEPICCEAREGTWHWEGHSLKSPAGEYFDYDAHGFKVYVAEQLNAYHATAALAADALRAIAQRPDDFYNARFARDALARIEAARGEGE